MFFRIVFCLLATFSILKSRMAQADTETPLPELIVTAQKRDQPALDVPFSLSVLSRADIERAGAWAFRDLLLSVPGVSYSASQPGLNRYSIRGISTAAASPTTGIYLDDVALLTIGTSFSGAIEPELIDIDRIEVLKGPQGTLYGGSAMGGAIKYVSREPEMDRFSLSTSGDLGTTERGAASYEAAAILNAPLVEGLLAARLAAAYRSESGYIDNVRNGEVQVWTRSATSPPAAFVPLTYPSQSEFARDNANDRGITTARGSLEFLPAPNLKFIAAAFIQRSDQSNPDEFFTNLPAFQNTARFGQPTHDALNVYSLNVTQDFGAVSVVSLTGYVDRTLTLDRDFSLYIGLLVPPLLSQDSTNFSVTSSKTFSQELRATSADSQSRWKWTGGLYYSEQRDQFDQLVNSSGAGDFFATGTDATFSGTQLTRTHQTAAFGDVTYAVGRHWDVIGGFRWFDVKQRIDGSFDGVFNGGHTEIAGVRSADSGFTKRIAIEYRPAETHAFYANASQGFRPGGANMFAIQSPLCQPDLRALNLTQAPASFQSDRLWTYELGSKNAFEGSRATLDAALFYTDWRNIQQQVTLPSCAFSFVGNVGAANVKGAEVSAEIPLGKALTLGGDVSYSPTRITASAPGVSAQVGQALLDTPRWMASFHAQYRFPSIGAWESSLRADYEYHGTNLREFESETPVTYSNGAAGSLPDATQIQKAYDVVNANLLVNRGRSQYRLYVDNLLNAAPYLDFRRDAGFSAATTLRPRTIGLALKMSF
jgi:iron complex outermembrane receptor protein